MGARLGRTDSDGEGSGESADPGQAGAWSVSTVRDARAVRTGQNLAGFLQLYSASQPVGDADVRLAVGKVFGVPGDKQCVLVTGGRPNDRVRQFHAMLAANLKA